MGPDTSYNMDAWVSSLSMPRNPVDLIIGAYNRAGG